MLVLTRQNLPVLDGTAENAEAGVNKGAYIISEANGDLDGIIIATGSEVKLALDTQAALEAEGCMSVLFQCHHKISLMNKMLHIKKKSSSSCDKTFGYRSWN